MEYTQTDPDEIDVLGLLVTLAESWILLVVGPLVVAALVFGYLQFQSSNTPIPSETQDNLVYVSSAEVSLPEQDVISIFSSDSIELALAPLQSTTPKEQVLEGLTLSEANDVNKSILTLSLSEANMTRDILNNLLTNYSQNYVEEMQKNVQDELTDITDRKAQLSNHLVALENALTRINTNEQFDGTAYMMAFNARSKLNHALEGLDIQHGELVQLQTIQGIELAQLRLNLFQLTAKNESAIILGQVRQTTTSRMLLIAGFAGFVTGFILLVFILIRKSFQTAASNPEGAEKIARIKRSFKLK